MKKKKFFKKEKNVKVDNPTPKGAEFYPNRADAELSKLIGNKGTRNG
jgi:hypothetical protein